MELDNGATLCNVQESPVVRHGPVTIVAAVQDDQTTIVLARHPAASMMMQLWSPARDLDWLEGSPMDTLCTFNASLNIFTQV